MINFFTTWSYFIKLKLKNILLFTALHRACDWAAVIQLEMFGSVYEELAMSCFTFNAYRSVSLVDVGEDGWMLHLAVMLKLINKQACTLLRVWCLLMWKPRPNIGLQVNFRSEAFAGSSLDFSKLAHSTLKITFSSANNPTAAVSMWARGLRRGKKKQLKT